MSELKNTLLDLLRNDPDIRNALRAAMSDEEPPAAPLPDKDTSELEQRCKRAERALEEAQETIFAQEQRLSAMRQQCGRMQEVLAPYARLETVYGHFLELPEDIRDICGVFLNEFSPLSFAITGAEENTLLRLHELICTQGTAMDEPVLSVLNEAFDFFFDLYLVGVPHVILVAEHQVIRRSELLHQIQEMLLRTAEAPAGHMQMNTLRKAGRILGKQSFGIRPVIRQNQFPIIAVLRKDRIDHGPCVFFSFIGG